MFEARWQDEQAVTVNFLPQAWLWAGLQAAEEGDRDPRVYYLYSFMYALPAVRNGFEQDWFSVSMLVLCVLHVQAERIARTEPEAMTELLGGLRVSVGSCCCCCKQALAQEAGFRWFSAANHPDGYFNVN